MASLHATSAFPSAFHPVLPGPDPLEQMAIDDREDWALLRLVLAVSVATVLLAVASTLVV